MPLDELMMPKILDEGLMSFIKLNKELKIYKTIVWFKKNTHLINKDYNDRFINITQCFSLKTIHAQSSQVATSDIELIWI